MGGGEGTASFSNIVTTLLSFTRNADVMETYKILCLQDVSWQILISLQQWWKKSQDLMHEIETHY